MSIKSANNLVQEALTEVKTITVEEALKDFNNDKINLIDIRDIRELEKGGRVKNSHHIPRGMLEFWMDPNSPYFKEGKIDQNNIFKIEYKLEVPLKGIENNRISNFDEVLNIIKENIYLTFNAD